MPGPAPASRPVLGARPGLTALAALLLLLLLGNGAERAGSAVRSATASNPMAPAASLTWDPRFYLAGPDGPGYALLADDDFLYLGGSFLGIGPLPVRGIARFDGSTWSPLGSGTEGAVVTLCRYRGELIAGGSFPRAGDVPASNIASWDGNTWSPLGGGVDGVIRSTVIFGDDLVVTGDFDSAGAAPASRIARWDGTHWLPLGEGLPEAVTGVAVYRGDLYAACLHNYYTNYQNWLAYVYRWDGSTWTPIATGENLPTWGASPAIYGLYVHEDRLFALGDAMFFDGGGGGLHSWDGSVWRDEAGYGWPDPDDGSAPIHAATNWRGDLVVGGSFRSQYAGDHAGVAIRSSSGWTPVGAGRVDGGVRALAVYRGDLFVAGGFYMTGAVVAPNLARYDGHAWYATTESGQGIVGTVRAVAWLGPDVIAGGLITHAGDQPVQNIARWDGSRWLPMGAGLNGMVNRLIPFAGGVVAAGDFSRAGDLEASQIAVWNGTEWSPLGAGLEYGWVGDIIEFQGELIAGGRFERSGDRSVPYAARWDSQEWQPMPGLDGAVICLTTYRDSLLAGGDFAGHLSRWTGTTWRPFHSAIHGRAEVLAGLDSCLFLTGGYAYSVPNAWWNGVAWQPLRFGDYRVEPVAFGSHAGRPLAGTRPYDPWIPTSLFAWSGTELVPVSGGPDGPVRALHANGPRLALGGDFTRAGGRSSWKFALAVDPEFPEASGWTASRNGPTAAITWEVSPGGESAFWRVYRDAPGVPRALVTPDSVSGAVAYDVVDPEPPTGDADYWIEQLTPDGTSAAWYGPIHLAAQPPGPCCETLRIGPNPASGSITLHFTLASSGSVRGTLLDLAGRKVAEIRPRLAPAGEQEMIWHPRTPGGGPLPSGVYWLRIESTEATRTVRVVWLS